MTEGRQGRKQVAGPLLISALAHVALLVLLSTPGCAISQPWKEQPERPKESDASQTTMSVDLWHDPPSPPRKPPRVGDEICDPNAPPEYYHFDIKPGPATDRIYQVARAHFGEIIMATDSLAGKRSRALRGWFRPMDAVRLLAGDAGLCVFDLGDGVGVNYCRGSDAPLSRSNEAWIRQEWEPPDCTTPKPALMPDPAAA